MGVKFNREYEDISEDLSQALLSIEDCYEFFGMEAIDWQDMDHEERYECVRTLSDDLFYALGTDPKLGVGSGTVEYDKSKHMIKVTVNSQLTHVVKLI